MKTVDGSQRSRIILAPQVGPEALDPRAISDSAYSPKARYSCCRAIHGSTPPDRTRKAPCFTSSYTFNLALSRSGRPPQDEADKSANPARERGDVPLLSRFLVPLSGLPAVRQGSRSICLACVRGRITLLTQFFKITSFRNLTVSRIPSSYVVALKPKALSNLLLSKR